MLKTTARASTSAIVTRSVSEGHPSATIPYSTDSGIVTRSVSEGHPSATNPYSTDSGIVTRSVSEGHPSATIPYSTDSGIVTRSVSEGHPSATIPYSTDSGIVTRSVSEGHPSATIPYSTDSGIVTRSVSEGHPSATIPYSTDIGIVTRSVSEGHPTQTQSPHGSPSLTLRVTMPMCNRKSKIENSVIKLFQRWIERALGVGKNVVGQTFLFAMWARMANRNVCPTENPPLQPRRTLLNLEVMEDRLAPSVSPLIVASYQDSSLYEINPQTGAVLNTLIVPYSSSSFVAPAGLTFGPDGNLYISVQGRGAGSDAILEYNFATNALSTFIPSSVLDGIANAEGASLFNPAGLQFGPDGNLYVSLNAGAADTPPKPADGEVIRFHITTTGGVLSYNPSDPIAPVAVATGMYQPVGLTFGANAGNATTLYIADSVDDSVVAVANATSASPTQSTYIKGTDPKGTNPAGGMQSPVGVTWGPDGDLYIVDAGPIPVNALNQVHQGNVFRYDPTTTALTAVTPSSGAGDLTGQFPSDVEFDSQGHMLTANLGMLPATNLTGSINQYSAPTYSVNFNDLSLTPQSYNNGANLPGYFISDSATFNNSYDPTYGDWSGWAYSNVSDITTPNFVNQYAAYAPQTAQGSGQNTANYAVAFDFAPGASTITLPAGYRPESVAITNATYPALVMLTGQGGNGFARQFQQGDYFLLTITGLNAQGQSTGTVPFYLANYQFTNPAQDYVVSNWTNVDLSSLGAGTTELSFGLTSTDTGMYGINTPTYFALDNLAVAPAGGTSFQTLVSSSQFPDTMPANPGVYSGISPGQLLVSAAPVVTSSPASQDIDTGTSTTFTASASGSPSPSVQWQVNTGSGGFTNISNNSIYSGATTVTLTITGATAAMSGYQYQAVFTNFAGSATTLAATLTVTPPPSLAGLPVINGNSAVINIVSATGDGTTATITTDGAPHGFWVGELVTLTGVAPGGPGGLAGTVTVTGVPSATSFQFASSYLGSETLSGATVTAALAGAQRSMVDSIVYNFTEPVTLTAAAFSISVVVDNTSTGNMVGVAPTLNVAPVPFTNEWVVTFTDPVNNSVIGNSIANGAYSISINPALVTAVSDGQILSAGETDTFYRLFGDVTGAQSVKNGDANAFNRAWGNFYYSANFNAALDFNDDGKFTNIDANAFNRAFNTRYDVVTTI